MFMAFIQIILMANAMARYVVLVSTQISCFYPHTVKNILTRNARLFAIRWLLGTKPCFAAFSRVTRSGWDSVNDSKLSRTTTAEDVSAAPQTVTKGFFFSSNAASLFTMHAIRSFCRFAVLPSLVSTLPFTTASRHSFLNRLHLPMAGRGQDRTDWLP